MKKLLIATTALVATAGMASADITISGHAAAGIHSGLDNKAPTAAVVAAAESTQVESALSTDIFCPPSNEPESEASLKANSAEAAIAGVRVSIGPVNPNITPILISAKVLVVIVETNKNAAKINFLIIFPLIVNNLYKVIRL